MAVSTQGDADRRVSTRERIDHLLAARRQLLVLYARVTGVPPYDEVAPSAELLTEFAQALVDYVAAGHFGLYQRIPEGTERRVPFRQHAEGVYARIAESTERAIAWNDAWERSGRTGLSVALARQVSELGEHLASRIDLEDGLIAAMRTDSR